MAKLIWTEKAIDDLSELAEYVAISDRAAAKQLVQRILSSVRRLEQYPESGRRLPELPLQNYREVIIPPSRIVYRIEKENVFVIRVIRQERDLRRLMLGLNTHNR
ncbi:Toxin RelE2 [Marinobacterium sp. xm-g-59]|uniref:type II toxin-antitoxin system RelE/ParE family toxin n=1 Tax=Marinobacterium sp. xm-g-59 TaxID=2497748 RepID=UPI0015680F62|nr:type II toxin-antitoxin system RelE/ParE family toxin [Marinobacterium sp. xm-g-59]NRP95451.1 Toxin RelE2 [Marinobacterium sp. xm-g-59]